MRILVVDDDPGVRNALQRALKLEGYDVELAVDGMDGLEQAASGPDAVILDVMMPNMDGLECTRKLKANPDTRDIPIIMLSAFAERKDILAGLEAGADEYLSKPLHECPAYADLKTDERYQQITARHVLGHSTGFPNWRFLTQDQRLNIKFPPGERYSYSGEGINLLQMVVEEITGKSLEDLAQEKVFGPLGMTRSSYVWQRRQTVKPRPGERGRRPCPGGAPAAPGFVGPLRRRSETPRGGPFRGWARVGVGRGTGSGGASARGSAGAASAALSAAARSGLDLGG